MISRIRGDVEVRYVRCVSELNKGNADDVSSAKETFQHEIYVYLPLITSSVVQLRTYTDACLVLSRKSKVGLAHGGQSVRRSGIRR